MPWGFPCDVASTCEVVVCKVFNPREIFLSSVSSAHFLPLKICQQAKTLLTPSRLSFSDFQDTCQVKYLISYPEVIIFKFIFRSLFVARLALKQLRSFSDNKNRNVKLKIVILRIITKIYCLQDLSKTILNFFLIRKTEM